MNYHIMIDHWFLDDFIETAEKICQGQNVYVLTFAHQPKYIRKTVGIQAPFGSQALEQIVRNINVTDRVYVHWFHEPVMNIIARLNDEVKVYVLFWGGDFMGMTRDFFKFNFDSLTKEYLRRTKKKVEKSTTPAILQIKPLAKRIINRVLLRYKSKGEVASDQVKIRSLFMRRLDFFCHWNRLDMELVKSAYGGDPQFLHFYYGGGLDLIPEPKFNSWPVCAGPIRVWLGNSDSATNNHLDALAALSHFKDENLTITCPLNYGFDQDYAETVVHNGAEMFQSKWRGVRNFMPLQKYLQLQEETDIAVMYHNRSQASGNVIAFLKMGKKLFMKSQSTLYKLLKDNGIVIFDANELAKMSFRDFAEPLTSDEVKLNSQRISRLFSDDGKVESFKRILL